MSGQRPIEELLRELAPQVLAAVARRQGQFDACEDAVQEALLAAALQWPASGVPDRPRSWLLRVAGRALVDQWRADSARRRREQTVAALQPAGREPAAEGAAGPADSDDTLVLLFLCCHPALSPPSQLALTLRAVGGLRTAEIAAAFLVPEATMAQRISRAKQRIRGAGARFESRWPWCTARKPGSRCSARWTPTTGWRPPTASTRSGHTCSNAPATPPQPASPTCRRPG